MEEEGTVPRVNRNGQNIVVTERIPTTIPRNEYGTTKGK